MTKRAAVKRQAREGILDSRGYSEDSKVRRLPTPHTQSAWSPHPSDRKSVV